MYELASAFVTDVNVRVPLYFPFPKGCSDEFEGLGITTPFLNHWNVIAVCNGLYCEALHSKKAVFPSSTLTRLLIGVGGPSTKALC